MYPTRAPLPPPSPSHLISSADWHQGSLFFFSGQIHSTLASQSVTQACWWRGGEKCKMFHHDAVTYGTTTTTTTTTIASTARREEALKYQGKEEEKRDSIPLLVSTEYALPHCQVRGYEIPLPQKRQYEKDWHRMPRGIRDFLSLLKHVRRGSKRDGHVTATPTTTLRSTLLLP